MNKITLTTDILVPAISLVMIMVCIVGATIGINTLMKGKVINFLLNKKLLLIIASILAFLFALAFFSIPLAVYWYDYLWFAYSIALIFVIANFIPSIVLYLKEVHQNNLEDIKEQQFKEV